jgi:hypothetical protein
MSFAFFILLPQAHRGTMPLSPVPVATIDQVQSRLGHSQWTPSPFDISASITFFFLLRPVFPWGVVWFVYIARK